MMRDEGLRRAAGEPNQDRRGIAMASAEAQPNEASGLDQERRAEFRELDHYVPADLLDPSFPAAVRGYERRAVDGYVQRVNRVIAEIKVSASPRAAVRHALEQTEQQVSGLLERARETADELIARSREEAEAEADATRTQAAELLVNTNAEAEAIKKETDALRAKAESQARDLVETAGKEAEAMLASARLESEAIVSRSEAEADEQRETLRAELASLQDEAESRMRALQADTHAVWERRHALVEEIKGTADRLAQVATTAADRHSAEPDLVAALDPERRSQPEEPARGRTGRAAQ
jgi:cell division septum initiation protein DivIVA